METSGFLFNDSYEKLQLTTKISMEYYNIYESYLPRFKTTQILLDIGAITHQDYAKNLFNNYINSNNDTSTPTHVLHCNNCHTETVTKPPSPTSQHRIEMLYQARKSQQINKQLNEKILKDKFFS